MKKVLAIVLSLSMVLGSFGMAFAADATTANISDVAGTNCEEAVTALMDLGVVTGYEDGTYKPDNIVTRAEMAVLVVNALGLKNYVTENAKSTFTDMSGYGWAEGYISYAQSLGIISGYGDGTFKPGKTVSYDEAATMLVAALGYTPVSLQGSWPGNYVSKAQSLGILDKVTAGPAGANRGDVAVMLYQTIDQQIGTVDNENRWQANTVSGGLGGDYMIGRLGADKVDRGTIIVGTEGSDLNLKPYVGKRASAYYKNNKVIAVADVDSEYIKGSFDSAANPSKFTGDDDDVEYTLPGGFTSIGGIGFDWSIAGSKGTDDTDFFVNGEYKGSKIAITTDATISVKVSGKKIDRVDAIMTWDVKTNGAHDRVNAGQISAIKDDKQLLSFDFETLKDGSIDMTSFELVGVSSLDKIAKDDVVYVYADSTSNHYITKVEVSNASVSGEVSRVKGTGSDTKYTIDGKEYKISPEGKPTLELGDEVKAYLDPNGKIYDVENISASNDNYAVVVAAPGADGGFGDYKVKLFTKAGDETLFNFKDKSSYEDSTASKAAIGSLVTYDVNKDGKITALNTLTSPAALTQNSSRLSKSGTISRVNDGTDTKNRLAKDGMIVFTYDSAQDEYDVIKVENVKDDEDLVKGTVGSTGSGVVALDKKGKVASMIVDKNATKYNETFGLISDYGTAKNSDGDKVMEITAVIDGKLVTALTDNTTTSTTYDTSALYKFEFDGDVITSATKMTKFTTNSDDITSTTIGAFDTTGAFTTVSAIDGNRFDMNGAGFEVVRDAKAYYATFDKDGGFDAWNVGNISNVYEGYQVLLYQVDKDSDNWDIVVYVKNTDVKNGYVNNLNFAD